MWYLSAALFILLSPGFLITLPPLRRGGLWMSGKTSLTAVLVHAVIFVVVGNFLWNYFLQKSGFAPTKKAPKKNMLKMPQCCKAYNITDVNQIDRCVSTGWYADNTGNAMNKLYEAMQRKGNTIGRGDMGFIDNQGFGSPCGGGSKRELLLEIKTQSIPEESIPDSDNY